MIGRSRDNINPVFQACKQSGNGREFIRAVAIGSYDKFAGRRLESCAYRRAETAIENVFFELQRKILACLVSKG